MAGGERMAASCREKPRKYGSVVWLLDERFGCGGAVGVLCALHREGRRGIESTYGVMSGSGWLGKGPRDWGLLCVCVCVRGTRRLSVAESRRDGARAVKRAFVLVTGWCARDRCVRCEGLTSYNARVKAATGDRVATSARRKLLRSDDRCLRVRRERHPWRRRCH